MSFMIKNKVNNFILKNHKFFNAFWAIISKLLSGVKLVVIGIIVARYLGPKDFGSFSYCISFVTLFSVLAEFRFHNIIIREVSESKINTEKILGSAFYSCFFFSLLGYILLVILVNLVEKDANLKYLILIYGISYFFQTLRFLRAFFIAKYKNDIIFRVEILVGLIVMSLGLLLGIMGQGIIAFIVLRVFDVLMISTLLVVFYQLEFKRLKKWRFDKQVSIDLIKNSSPLVLSSLALVIFQQFDKIMIKQFLDEYSVGQYTAAVSLISLIVFAPVVLSEVISPYLIATREKIGKEAYIRNTQLFSDYIFWGSFLLCLIVTPLSNFIINIVYGNEYLEAIMVMQIFSWQGVLIAMGSVAAQIMIIDNTHQKAYLKSIAGGLINIVLNIIWIPKYGIIGAVWASLLAYVVSSYIAHFFILRYRYIFFVQTRSITHGLLNIFIDLKNRKKRLNAEI